MTNAQRIKTMTDEEMAKELILRYVKLMVKIYQACLNM